MRTLVLVVAIVILAVSFAVIPAPSPARSGPSITTSAADVPELTIRIVAEQVGLSYVFAPKVLLIPQVPITMNVTFYNNQSVASGVQHTFTIDDKNGNRIIDTGLVSPQTNVSFQFTINSMTNVTFSNNTVTNLSFTPGPAPTQTPVDNGTIQWYCIPHVGSGMTGVIMLASAVPTAAQPEKGIFLRAYWIGMIGIAAMLVWIGITYYVVKSSSPHFKDNKAHVRKGLP